MNSSDRYYDRYPYPEYPRERTPEPGSGCIFSFLILILLGFVYFGAKDYLDLKDWILGIGIFIIIIVIPQFLTSDSWTFFNLRPFNRIKKKKQRAIK